MPENIELYDSSDKTNENVQELTAPNDVNLKIRKLQGKEGNGILKPKTKITSKPY